MSIPRHHAEWLSLVEVSGPFLSMPVLLRVFPQGLDAHDPELSRELRVAIEEWRDNQLGLKPNPAIQTAWVRFVLFRVLGLPLDVVLADQALDPTLKATFPEHGVTLRPDFAIQHPERDTRPRLLGMVESPQQQLSRALPGQRWKASPISRMVELLRATNVPLGLVTNGDEWVLVAAPRGETTSFVTWFSELWLDEPLTLRAFRALLGTRRFFGVSDDDTLPALFAESANSQQEVTDQLGEQVRAAVELLMQSLDRIDLDRGRTLLAGIDEPRLYEAALTVMMRLVFLFSAEERGLLLLGDALYDEFYALSTLRAQLRTVADQQGEEILERRYDAWARLLATFRMVYGGVQHEALRLPAYGGALFDPDRFPFLEGRAQGTSWRNEPAQPLAIDNRTVLHLLEALQILRIKVPGGGTEPRRLSFRALDIEQIGHVYEGMLDHTARRATAPVLGLIGGKGTNPEQSLAALEAAAAKGQDDLLAFLKDATGRSLTILKRALTQTPDLLEMGRLRVACHNNESLLTRTLPFFGLLRRDAFERPVVIATDSVYVTAGTDRRQSGTHYTPRALTEPVVQHTLEPLVYVGPAEGLPKAEWRLRSAEELLALRICDMAMGSGAFLVQACRYLAERLVEAWELREQAQPKQPLALPSADPATGALSEHLLPPDTEERLLLARRLIADRCLYGVDKNPLAAEMAKLSLWLVTLQKNRPFTFLDHALRAGDSLLGIASLDQLRRWSLADDTTAEKMPPAFLQELHQALERALDLRDRLHRIAVNDIRDAEAKHVLLVKAHEAMEPLLFAADMLAATALTPGSERLEQAKNWLFRFTEARHNGDAPELAKLRQEVDAKLGAHRPFHWPLEFPEVFVPELGAPDIDVLLEQAQARQPLPTLMAGFTAMIGNPPFQGGQKITGALGTDYRDYLVQVLAKGQRGSADLAAYFFLRAASLLRPQGLLGLIATNTIAQGNTREVGLQRLIGSKSTQPMTIIRAIPSERWPGLAALEVAHVWMVRGPWQGESLLNGQLVAGITSFLTKPGAVSGAPKRLAANANKSFQGSLVLGMGFTLTQEEAQTLIGHDLRNREVLFPYLNGEDLNSRPDQSPSRWVINFFDWDLERAKTYTEPFRIVEERVKPEREKQNDRGGRKYWWRHLRMRSGLYETIKNMSTILVITIHTKYCAFSFTENHQVYSHALTVFALDKYYYFSILSSNFHDIWAFEHSSSLGHTLRYAPSDCFETFPFPEDMAGLEAIGEAYHHQRSAIMQARQEGLTQTYNRFHNPEESAADIVALRELHVAMDRAVRDAYGWGDLALEHGFHETRQGLRYTISEAARREVLDRLLALNHARYAAEQGEASERKASPTTTKARRKRAQPDDEQQTRLL